MSQLKVKVILMIFNKVKLKNFMAYYGELEFDFPLSENKNVSIIYAPNDTGKSCFFKGITFALYGSKRGEKSIDLINKNALDNNINEAFVSIFGEHNDKSIQITRKISPRSDKVQNLDENDFMETFEIFEDDKPIVSEDYALKYDYINSIVHENASKYFFFDGEKIEAYNIASNTDYKEAITRILGIKEIEYAKSDFNKLENEYERKRDSLFEKKKEAKSIIDDKKILEDELKKLDENITGNENEIKQIRNRIVKLEDQLKEHKGVQEQIERKQKLRSKKEELKKEIKKIESKKINIFKERGTIILGSEIAENIKLTDDYEYSEEDNFKSTENLKLFLNHLEEKDKCICGNDITKIEKENINKYISNNMNEDNEYLKEKERNRAFNRIYNYTKYAADAKRDYLSICQDKIKLQKELNLIEEEFTELQKEIGNYDEEAGSRISEEITREESKLEKVKKTKIIREAKKKEKKDELDDIKKELSKFSDTNIEFQMADKKLEKAENIKKIFKEYLELLTRSKKEEVENKSTDVFMQLTNKKNKYKGLILDDDYDLKVELNDGTKYTIEPGKPHNPSTGQSKIISLSYIAGINQSSNSQAPIVIDNPLGLFSSEHRERVTGYIPKFGKQVIFMVTTADLSQKYKNIIEPYINVEYHLKDNSDRTWNKTTIVERKEK